MTSVVLFKFHQSFDVCRERVAMLRSFNPNIPVHALYGGPAGGRAAARAALGDLAVDIQQAPDRGADWAWLHNDLMTKQWYRTHGRDIEFDRVYEYDWDLLTAAPLSDIYPDTADDEIALCAAVQFTEEIEQRWVWTNRSESFAQFMAYMGDTFGLRSLRWASLGPGPLLSRAFLEEFLENRRHRARPRRDQLPRVRRCPRVPGGEQQHAQVVSRPQRGSLFPLREGRDPVRDDRPGAREARRPARLSSGQVPGRHARVARRSGLMSVRRDRKAPGVTRVRRGPLVR